MTLQTECSLTPAGSSALIFKPLSAGEFTSTANDAEELLRMVADQYDLASTDGRRAFWVSKEPAADKPDGP